MHSAVVDQITVAALSPETRTTALRLLRLAHPENGHVAISQAEASAICGIAWGTMRRQLGQLAKAHLIHYSTNGDGYLYCTFKAFVFDQPSKNSTPDARGRAPNVEKFDGWRAQESDAENGTRVDARQTSKNSTPDARGRAPDAANLTHARAIDLDLNTGRKVGRKDQPTYLPEGGTGEGGPDEDEQASSVALLTDPDVGMWEQTARRLAARYPFDRILRHVLHWRYQYEQGDVTSPMVLESRLARGMGPPIGPGARASPLYRRHMHDADSNGETEADRRRRYIPDEFSDIAIE